MKFGSLRVFAAFVLYSFLLPFELVGAAPKPLLVHYMPWYVAKPYSSSWGWHWTMNRYNPDEINASGEQRIASWYYPLIGPYDSADPAVLEYHVLLMKLAGVDGVLVDWYGMDNFLDYGVNNQRTSALFDWTRKAGLKFSIVYEDRTIQVEIDRGFIYASNAVAHAQKTMLYLQTNYFADPSYLRRGTQPVLLNFGPQYFKSGQWPAIFSVLAVSNQPAFFTLDNRATGAIGAYTWPPMWMSQSTGGVLSTASLNSYLSNFEQAARFWPAYISSAFPRFHDIYSEAGVGTSYGSLADNNGETFRSTLTRAMTNNSYAVQVATWNDYGEGTVVEPTRQYGYRDLGILQDLRRRYLDPGFSRGTNDLTLATRLYTARREHHANPVVSAEMDRVFARIVSGNLSNAHLQLQGIESRQPVLYDARLDSDAIRFVVGGYIPSAGVQVQASGDLSQAEWSTVATFSATTNALEFSAPHSTLAGPTYFRVLAN